MSDYRAPRVWRVVEVPGAFGNFRVLNQFGGFEGQHKTREAAVAAGRAYVKEYGDTFEEPTDDAPVLAGPTEQLALVGMAYGPGEDADQTTIFDHITEE